MIKDSGDYLLALINDLLELAKLEAGKLAIRREPVPLARLLDYEVHAFMDSRAQEKGLRFSLRFDGSVPKAIVTDAARLRQVLINLLANVIKFTESGQIELTTRFDGARTQLEFEVVARGSVSPQSPTTRRMIDGILAVEEEHAEDLATLLERYDQPPYAGSVSLQQMNNDALAMHKERPDY